MPKLISIHEIVRGAKADRQVIAPGKTFDATDKDAQYLIGVGAAKAAAAQVVAQQAPVVTPVTDQRAGDEDDAPVRDLSKMLKAELLAIAAELQIEGHADMTVPQLREAIEAEEAAADDEPMI